VDIRGGQKLTWENKLAKGFNTTDVPLEFCLLQGEVAEAFDAWRKGRGSVGEELADVALFLFSLAEMTGVDLQGEVEAKIAKNVSRAYGAGDKGTPGAGGELCERSEFRVAEPVAGEHGKTARRAVQFVDPESAIIVEGTDLIGIAHLHAGPISHAIGRGEVSVPFSVVAVMTGINKVHVVETQLRCQALRYLMVKFEII